MQPIRTQAGLSLVETMVALALGLIVLLAGSTVLIGQLQEHKRLLSEARLMQDLRTVADLLGREARRAGHWRGMASALPDRMDTLPARLLHNPYAALETQAGTAASVRFQYARDDNHQVDTNEAFGLRLRDGSVQMLLGAGWQSLTDPQMMRVTALDIVPDTQELPLPGLCDRPCPSSPTSGVQCPPHLEVRSLTLSITARSAIDHTVVRHLATRVRLRNDVLTGTCPA